jgi:hypothetical protein
MWCGRPARAMNRLKEKIKPDFLEDPQIREAIEDILHPYLSKKDPVIAVQFGVPKDKEDEWREAISFASAHNRYTSTKVGRLMKHRIEFSTDQVWEIFQMYQMLEKSPHLEIFIDNRKLPYAATLWLPLLWFYL